MSFGGEGEMVYAGISIDRCTDLHIIRNGILPVVYTEIGFLHHCSPFHCNIWTQLHGN